MTADDPESARFLESAGGGRFLLQRDLTFSTVSEILTESEELFPHHESITVDMAGVRQADSAGLALLIEWLSLANARGREIRYENIPEQLKVIARISEVEKFIGSG